MRSWLLISSLALLVLLSTACTTAVASGSGQVVAEPRPVGDFRAVALSGIGTLLLQQGEHESLVIEAEDNILPHIRSEVRNRKLSIGFRGDLLDLKPSKPVLVRVTVKNLQRVELSGGAGLQASDITADRLMLTVYDAGQAQVTGLKARELDVQIRGGGRVATAGQVARQLVQVDGAGEYLAPDLTSSMVTVAVGGAGRATVHATDMLEAQISGAGSLDYVGNPRVRQHVSGAGRLQRLPY